MGTRRKERQLRSFERAGKRGYPSTVAFSRVLTEPFSGALGYPADFGKRRGSSSPRAWPPAVMPGYEDAEDRPRKKKLEAGREGSRAMPATVVKELLRRRRTRGDMQRNNQFTPAGRISVQIMRLSLRNGFSAGCRPRFHHS